MVLKYLFAQEAATAVEYTFFAAGIAMAIVLVVFTLGDQIYVIFDELLSAASSANAVVNDNN